MDLKQGTLRLNPGETKNKDGRVVYLNPELQAVLRERLACVDRLCKETGSIIPRVFPHLTGRFRGQRIKEFRRAWQTACKKAGTPWFLRHDFRRTAVRNMERSGISRSVATKITGHRSEAVYRRYAIVSDQDLQDASRRLGHNLAIVRGKVLDTPVLSVEN